MVVELRAASENICAALHQRQWKISKNSQKKIHKQDHCLTSLDIPTGFSGQLPNMKTSLKPVLINFYTERKTAIEMDEHQSARSSLQIPAFQETLACIRSKFKLAVQYYLNIAIKLPLQSNHKLFIKELSMTVI
uniref:Uncharacterized protein n=1 Tax=Solanum lycopersicum TaxID=4081 RepID=A0A3Q7FDT9_SOLLC